MKTPLLVLLVLALLIIGLAPKVSATTQPQQTTYSGYAPAILNISFPETTLVNVTVLPEAGGLFTYSVSTTTPDSTVRINLNSSDIYNIYFSIVYPVRISGNVSWTLFSTGLLSSGGSDSFTNQSIFSTFLRVELLPYQTFATPEQIANATSSLILYHLNQVLQQQNQANNAQISLMQSELETTYAILGIVVVVMIALFVFVVTRLRR